MVPITIVQTLDTDYTKYAYVYTTTDLNDLKAHQQTIQQSLSKADLNSFGGSQLLPQKDFRMDPYFKQFIIIKSLSEFESHYPEAKIHYQKLLY